ncbi:MAG: hypothetical protein COW30_12940 [Rhodospirillales bacterium CG15_BIG_FIL_POST_REV_8_21_14_020_66_15]|nr:MAG: hypothetical protein COW30_12940 [Rhodospirillales bacterium CG15_BIG_FIL_POST_REV_8_21_14_020_66_15]
MAEYGGWGGLDETRGVDPEDAFEMAVVRAMGDRIRANDEAAAAMWSALANVDWRHPETGDNASYTFRAAGDMIAAIRGQGTYMDWYCCGPSGTVSDEIAAAMALEGWVFSVD